MSEHQGVANVRAMQEVTAQRDLAQAREQIAALKAEVAKVTERLELCEVRSAKRLADAERTSAECGANYARIEELLDECDAAEGQAEALFETLETVGDLLTTNSASFDPEEEQALIAHTLAAYRKANPKTATCACCGKIFTITNETRRCPKCAHKLGGLGG